MTPSDRPRSPVLLDGENATLVLVAAVAAWGAFLAKQYGLWGYGEPGPGLFPFLVCLMTIGFAALTVAFRIAGIRQQSFLVEEEVTQVGPILWRKLAIYVAAILAWPLAMPTLGFVLSTAIALFAITRVAEQSGWIESAIVVVCAVALSWLVFDYLLGVPLPTGFPGIG